MRAQPLLLDGRPSNRLNARALSSALEKSSKTYTNSSQSATSFPSATRRSSVTVLPEIATSVAFLPASTPARGSLSSRMHIARDRVASPSAFPHGSSVEGAGKLGRRRRSLEGGVSHSPLFLRLPPQSLGTPRRVGP